VLTGVAVTSRLEDVATSQSSAAPTSFLRSPTSAAHEALAAHVSGPPAGPPVLSQSAPHEEMTAAVQSYRDDIVGGALGDFLARAKEVGGIVEQHVCHYGYCR